MQAGEEAGLAADQAAKVIVRIKIVFEFSGRLFSLINIIVPRRQGRR